MLHVEQRNNLEQPRVHHQAALAAATAGPRRSNICACSQCLSYPASLAQVLASGRMERAARLCAQREFVQHYMICMSSSRTHAIRGQIFERSKKRHCYTLYFSNVSSLIPQIFTRFGMDVWLHETHRWRTRTRCSLAPRNRSCTERPPR